MSEKLGRPSALDEQIDQIAKDWFKPFKDGSSKLIDIPALTDLLREAVRLALASSNEASLRAVLIRYGQHDASCRALDLTGDLVCTCGLRALQFP